MRATASDLQRVFSSNGTPFENFVNDLIRAAARACGGSANYIDWDPRTNAKDGGRDIVVRQGNPQGPGHFIPDRPSLWSVKSGADGIDPKKLRKEILPQKEKNHPKVQAALRAGQSYIWCAVHPASADQREAMRTAAREIAAELGVDPDLIDFRWQDRLEEEVNRFPNVIQAHLPDVEGRWAGVLTLDEWRTRHDLGNGWAGFGDRDALVTLIERHLLGREAPNVLHVAGLSGIGKTRAAFEACRRNPQLQGVFSLPRWTDLSSRLRRDLRAADAAFVVIDETPLEEVEGISREFADCPHRVRILTIGPASRQRARSYRDILVVAEPETDEEVLAVIRGPGEGLSEPVLRSIAAHSAHDLRLALMLVKASLREPDLRSVPIPDMHRVWDRLMVLFRAEVPDPVGYRRWYEVLTPTIDVIVAGDQCSELRGLAAYFGYSERDLLGCSSTAAECGLGIRPGQFFEPVPRALAVGLFLTLFRRELRDRLREFMRMLSEHPRLLRRFLERCQELPADAREEVAGEVGRVFLGWLGHGDVTVLTGREASRAFQAWAEFDPARGLAWLRRAVEAATPEQLLALDGEPDGSGGWRGRRQLVWLCQNLACFAEHFADCEATLFRLARHETEPQVGNNATGVWRSLFWPALGHTEAPFGDRFPSLLSRLAAATAGDLPLVLAAAFEAIEPRFAGMPYPARVVGGRVVPPAWVPDTHEQWRELRVEAAGRVLAAIDDLPPDLRETGLRAVVVRLRLLRELGLTDRVRGALRPPDVSPELRRELVVELDRQIGTHRLLGREEMARPNADVTELEAWRADLVPADLATRVQDLTARAYEAWGDAAADRAYDDVSNALVAAPDSFAGLAPWFDSGEAKGADTLAFRVGRSDESGRLAETVRGWMRAGRCRAVTAGYLIGVASRTGSLPEGWASELDALAGTDPEFVVSTTAAADIGGRGFERILEATDRLPPPASRSLRAFGFGRWHSELTTDQQVRILEKLVVLAEAGDPRAGGVGVKLVSVWSHRKSPPIDSRLVPHLFRLAEVAPAGLDPDGGYDWRHALGSLCPHDPVRAAEAVVGVMTTPDHPWRFDRENVPLLAEAARRDPDGVMGVIGGAILDPNRRLVFGVGVFRGLFEAVGLDAVRRWVEAHGPETLRWIARHFPSPTLGEGGEVVVPPLTAWLFTEREADQHAFEWFLMGRHHGASVWRGDQTSEVRAEMEPFLGHPLPRVREWAEDQIRFADCEANWFRQRDEEIERL